LVPTPGQDLFYFPDLHSFSKKKRPLFVYDGYTGSFIVTFSYMYIL
jgi:hypothetical protein